MLAFLQRMDHQQRTTLVKVPERSGEHAGFFYRIQGEGPPLVLLPLGLAPSQWEPLIPMLAPHYCTITLSGAMRCCGVRQQPKDGRRRNCTSPVKPLLFPGTGAFLPV